MNTGVQEYLMIPLIFFSESTLGYKGGYCRGGNYFLLAENLDPDDVAFYK